MPEWLQRYIPEGWSNQEVLIAAVGFTALTAIISLGLVTLVVVRLPADYFINDRSAERWKERHVLLRWPLLILQHVFGVILIGLGIIMSLPGVPGQGLLTILIGIMMLQFPGKKKFEMLILKRPIVRLGIDKLRTRFGRPPLQLDESPLMP